MKQLLACTLTACALVAPMAVAASSHTFVEAPVVQVEPVVRVITHKIPHQSCHDERVKVVQSAGDHSATPQILGAIIGATTAGALGHNSRYQPVIAGAGAVLGASIGHDVGHNRQARSYYVTEQRCDVDYELREEEKVIGYRVSYRYGDTIYHTETKTHPGRTIRLRVDLRPMD
ncbi:MAG: hypothetical protein HOC23_24980 [Halieaceae bacterium]|mgnify:CR=1 FL=1|nr:hypothetical protein [Halieaceae bacterium]